MVEQTNSYIVGEPTICKIRHTNCVIMKTALQKHIKLPIKSTLISAAMLISCTVVQ